MDTSGFRRHGFKTGQQFATMLFESSKTWFQSRKQEYSPYESKFFSFTHFSLETTKRVIG